MRTLRYAWVVLGLALAPLTATASLCNAPRGVLEDDAAAIISLARQLGMAGPLTLCESGWLPPVGCQTIIRVDSQPTVQNRRKRWQRLYLGRHVEAPDRQCPRWAEGTRTVHEGAWVAAQSNLSDMETWVFDFGDGGGEVRLGPGVSGETADIILQAFYNASYRDVVTDQRQMADVLRHNSRTRARDISSIDLVSAHQDERDVYDVRLGEMGIQALRVRIDDGAVTLLTIGMVRF